MLLTPVNAAPSAACRSWWDRGANDRLEAGAPSTPASTWINKWMASYGLLLEPVLYIIGAGTFPHGLTCKWLVHMKYHVVCVCVKWCNFNCSASWVGPAPRSAVGCDQQSALQIEPFLPQKQPKSSSLE
jgi:hypothetical protein